MVGRVVGTRTVKLPGGTTPRRFGPYRFDRARIDIVYQRQTGDDLLIIKALLVQVCREGRPQGRFALTERQEIITFGQTYRLWSGKDLWDGGQRVTIRGEETPETA